MSWLYRFSIRRPRLVLLLGLLAVAAVAPGVLRLHIRTDGHALVPTDAPEVQFDLSIRDEFGVHDAVIVLIETDHPQGIFNTDTLGLVVRLTESFAALPGVEPHHLFSLATEHSDRVWQGTLKIRRFLEPLPETTEELERLRDDLHAFRLYDGTLLSRDLQATCVMVGVPPGVDRPERHAQVLDVLESLGPTPERLRVIGAPVAEALLGTHILEDLGVPAHFLGHRSPGGADVPGVPTSLYELRVWIGRHVGLLPLVIIVLTVVLWLCFRSLAAAALPMMEVGAALAFVFGLMGWLGVPVYLTIAVLPIILAAAGVADEIHIYTRYRELLGRSLPSPDDTTATAHHATLIEQTLDEMWRPLVTTGVTTMVGFLSFALSPIAAVRAFGIFAAVGMLFCTLWTLTVIPAQLRLIHPRRFLGRPRKIANAELAHPPLMTTGFFQRLGPLMIRWRYAALLVGLIVAGLATFAGQRVQVQDSWIDGFAPESEFYQATQTFNAGFLGTHMLLTCVEVDCPPPLSGEIAREGLHDRDIHLPADLIDDPLALPGRWILLTRLSDEKEEALNPRTGRPRPPGRWASRIESAERRDDAIVITGSRRMVFPARLMDLYPGERVHFDIRRLPFREPETLERIDALESFLADQTHRAVGGVLGPGRYLETLSFITRARKEEHRVIPDDPYRIEHLWREYERIRGPERRRQLVNDDMNRALITIFMNQANYVDTAHLMADIRAYEKEHLADAGISLHFAGDVAVSQTLITAIVRTQVTSLGGSLLGIFLLTALLGRSFFWGILCVLPCTLAVMINFGVMSLVSMPLGVATSMFASMTLGIGVDYAIHLLERFRLGRRRGLAVEPAIAEAVRVTGPAVSIDALGVALGFGVMILSRVPANARLGGLLVVSLLSCLAATLLLLPALLRIFARRTEQSSPAPQASDHGAAGA